ncbi:hypothetical protein KAT73_03960, partial [candidate division WOR-3 bacterium]|nr:hypothetical protein [candidate division WOR-3 bacterium]
MFILFIFLSINLQDSNPLFFSFSVKDSTEFLLGIPPDGNLDIDIHDGIKNSVQILRTGILRNQRVALIRVNGDCEASINFPPYPSKDPPRGDKFEDILKKIIVNYDIAKYWKIEKSKGQKV